MQREQKPPSKRVRKSRAIRAGSFPPAAAPGKRRAGKTSRAGGRQHLLCHKVILQVIRGNYTMSLCRIAQKYIFGVANFRSVRRGSGDTERKILSYFFNVSSSLATRRENGAATPFPSPLSCPGCYISYVELPP